nr:plasma-membrane proton-efflux P-type ATPase [Bacteroidota bacterium]
MMNEFLSGEQAKTQSIDALFSIFSTSAEKGLGNEDVEERRENYGFNELAEKHVSPFLKFLKNFWGPIPWMIEAAIILSLIDQDWNDVAIIGSLLLINAFIEFFQSHKADNAIAELKKSLASKAKVKRDGTWAEVEARELVPGDIIRMRLGDVVPADVKLFEGDYLMIDESALTGESLPVEKHRDDVGFSGSVVKQGEMNALVYGTAANTFFGRTAKLVEGAKTKSHFQKAVIHIGDYLIILNFLLVMVVVITGLIRQESIWQVLQFALVLTVAAIPAALPAVLSVTMAVGAVKLSKKKAIISKLVAIEEMAGMDVLCSDKTGTITENILTIAGLHPIGDYNEDDIIITSALAAKAENKDPIDDAVINRLFKHDRLKTGFEQSKQLRFIPFDPVSKKTEAEIEQNNIRFRVGKGAPQVMLELCHNREIVAEEVHRIIHEAGSHGYRTLGVARTHGDEKWHFVGLISLSDPPREDSAETIRLAQEMGVEVKMITGDHQIIAREIAKRVNIRDNILPASEFVNLPDRRARRLVEEADGISEVYPEHKYEIVELLQMNGHIVGMTGDGVNDAPALKKADAGIAVAGATDAAKSAADIVLTLPGLSVIINAIQESRKIFQRMQSYAIYRISETIDVLFFTVLAILIFNQYPVTAIMIVLLAVFNDFPIMAISYDRVKYSMKPERWNMNKVIGIASVLGFTNVVFTFFIYLIGRDIMHFSGNELQTLVFAELSIAGNLTIFLSRTRGPLWSIRPGSGLVWATLISKGIISLIVAFGLLMAPIGWWVLFVWGYAMVQMMITDRVKLLAYRVFDYVGVKFKK